MTAKTIRFGTAVKAAVTAGFLGAGLATQATVINSQVIAEVGIFMTGAIVQSFDNIPGIVPVPITNFNPLDITGTSALFTKDPAQPAYFNSGGATFNDPASNPGTPIGIVRPDQSDDHAGPLGVVTPPFTLFDPGAFMEVIFPTPMSKVGVRVTHGTVQLILKDANNQNLVTGDVTVTGSVGSFIGITRDSADIGGVTLLGSGPFTINVFTYAATGDGGGGGGGHTVPDTGNGLNLAIAGAFLLWAGRNRGSN